MVIFKGINIIVIMVRGAGFVRIRMTVLSSICLGSFTNVLKKKTRINRIEPPKLFLINRVASGLPNSPRVEHILVSRSRARPAAVRSPEFSPQVDYYLIQIADLSIPQLIFASGPGDDYCLRVLGGPIPRSRLQFQ